MDLVLLGILLGLSGVIGATETEAEEEFKDRKKKEKEKGGH